MEHIYLRLYDPADTFLAPGGTIMDAAAVREQFPASQMFTYIVHTDAGGEVMYGFYSLSAMRSKYGISQALTGAEAVQAVENAMNAEKEAEAEAQASYISPEERIAAALEFQALSSLPDAE